MKRQISFGQALATVVGSVIGAGVFFKIGTITAQTGSSSMTLLVWVLAGIISNRIRINNFRNCRQP